MFRRVLLSLLKIALTVLVVCALLLFLLQAGMIYFPRAYGKGELARFSKLGGVRLEFQTGEGKQVAYYLPPAADAGAVPDNLWLLCGGNGALTLDYLDVALLAGREQGYLFADYPDYGECEGGPSPVTIAANADGALEALATHLGTTGDLLKPRFSAFGHSLGAAVVLRAAGDWGLRRAIVVAPFTSLMDFARARFGFPLCQVLRHRFDNRVSLQKIAAAGGKVTVFHGDADREVAVSNGRTLAAEFPGTIDYHEIPGGDHNGIVDQLRRPLAELMRPGLSSG